MVDPIITPLIIGFLTSLAVGAIVYIAYLTIPEVRNWFSQWQTNNIPETDDVGFTLTKKLEEGKFETIQGVFNKGKEQVKEARKIESNSLSSEIEDALDYDEGLIIYE